MVHRRRKGHNRERAIRHRWIAAGWTDAKRGDQSRAGHEESDVVVGERIVSAWSDGNGFSHILVPPFRCEVKDQLSLPGKRPMAAYDQAISGAKGAEIPLAIFHVHRRGAFVLLDFGHFLQIASCGTVASDVGSGSDGDLEPTHDSGESEVENAI